jgi:hypothetical protein
MPIWESGLVNTGNANDNLQNCAVCAVARFMGMNATGVSMLVAADLRQSRRVSMPRNHQPANLFIAYAHFRGVAVPTPARPDVDGMLRRQLYGIREFLWQRGFPSDFVNVGDVNNKMTDAEFLRAASRDADDTRYIVYLQHRNGYDAHYNYAEMHNGQIGFYDEQGNRPGGPGLRYGLRPIWPEETVAAGEDDDRYCVVLRCRV